MMLSHLEGKKKIYIYIYTYIYIFFFCQNKRVKEWKSRPPSGLGSACTLNPGLGWRPGSRNSRRVRVPCRSLSLLEAFIAWLPATGRVTRALGGLNTNPAFHLGGNLPPTSSQDCSPPLTPLISRSCYPGGPCWYPETQ